MSMRDSDAATGQFSDHQLQGVEAGNRQPWSPSFAGTGEESTTPAPLPEETQDLPEGASWDDSFNQTCIDPNLPCF